VTPPALLASLRRRGVNLLAEGGVLYPRPPGSLTEGERALVRQHKPALLALLAAEEEDAVRFAEEHWR
jgi:hypothetical protein